MEEKGREEKSRTGKKREGKRRAGKSREGTRREEKGREEKVREERRILEVGRSPPPPYQVQDLAAQNDSTYLRRNSTVNTGYCYNAAISVQLYIDAILRHPNFYAPGPYTSYRLLASQETRHIL